MVLSYFPNIFEDLLDQVPLKTWSVSGLCFPYNALFGDSVLTASLSIFDSLANLRWRGCFVTLVDRFDSPLTEEQCQTMGLSPALGNSCVPHRPTCQTSKTRSLQATSSSQRSAASSAKVQTLLPLKNHQQAPLLSLAVVQPAQASESGTQCGLQCWPEWFWGAAHPTGGARRCWFCWSHSWWWRGLLLWTEICSPTKSASFRWLAWLELWGRNESLSNL